MKKFSGFSIEEAVIPGQIDFRASVELDVDALGRNSEAVVLVESVADGSTSREGQVRHHDALILVRVGCKD